MSDKQFNESMLYSILSQLSIEVRPFNNDDLDAVHSIEKDSFTDPWPDSFFIYMHQREPDLFIVMLDGGEMVGFVVGELREIMFSGISHQFKVGHVLNIAVDQVRRRSGVGDRLMDEVEERFRRNNATRATLEVRESNVGAKGFYTKRGYQEIGRVRAYYQDEDALIMSKNL